MIDPEAPSEAIKDPVVINELKTECRKLVNNYSKDQFPGSQPVSMLRRHLDGLKNEPFVVCEKSDGVRYFLLFHKVESPYQTQLPNVWLVGRKFSFFPVYGFWPVETESAMSMKALLDGELIEEDDHVSKRKIVRYLIFDAVFANKNYVGNLSLLDRLRIAQTVSKKISDTWAKHASFVPPFIITVKPMYDKKRCWFCS